MWLECTYFLYYRTLEVRAAFLTHHVRVKSLLELFGLPPSFVYISHPEQLMLVIIIN